MWDWFLLVCKWIICYTSILMRFFFLLDIIHLWRSCLLSATLDALMTYVRKSTILKWKCGKQRVLEEWRCVIFVFPVGGSGQRGRHDERVWAPRERFQSLWLLWQVFCALRCSCSACSHSYWREAICLSSLPIPCLTANTPEATLTTSRPNTHCYPRAATYSLTSSCTDSNSSPEPETFSASESGPLFQYCDGQCRRNHKCHFIISCNSSTRNSLTLSF